ncbi:outer membrane protein assembly factor BamD [Ferruginibacter sp. HRS2-29]|uniref:outer membrane protein assembly factor BamD n=1 Tax=Ferruginibacter sp. HRS2-29 TaxID=2487334 RepID=UPI0020CE95A8|nr:outer membrane protein assembly factor BamD [Ferruginibacter sp. HRS2-29]MCP9750855.1 outer membrane protein assembly factor BamD [Ferruginibacter sp. HRS2-29]
MKLIKNVFAVILVSLVVVSCGKYSKIEKSKDVDFKLAKADEYYSKGSYRHAQELYESLFPVFKGTQKFEDLYYKYAYCYYYQGQYRDAENLFKGYLEVFPTSAKAEEVDYMRAYSFYKQSPKLELEQVNTVKAMNMMQSFINTHPGSERTKEATAIIDLCRQKLEQKEFRAAQLYYNLGQFRASAIAFADLLNNYPESAKGDEYKYMVVKSYYRFAKLSIIDKQEERYGKVTTEYQDFMDRYPDSKLLKSAEEYSNLSKNHIKDIQNEQTTSSAKR